MLILVGIVGGWVAGNALTQAEPESQPTVGLTPEQQLAESSKALSQGAGVASRRAANARTGALIGGGVGLVAAMAVGLAMKPKAKR